MYVCIHNHTYICITFKIVVTLNDVYICKYTNIHIHTQFLSRYFFMYGNIINIYFVVVKAFAFVHLWFAAHVRTAYTSVVPLFFQFSGFSFFSIVFPLMNTHLRVCAIVSQRGLGSRLGLDL